MKIIQICQVGEKLAALSDDGRVFKTKAGNYSSTAWVEITPFEDADVHENPKFSEVRHYD